MRPLPLSPPLPSPRSQEPVDIDSFLALERQQILRELESTQLLIQEAFGMLVATDRSDETFSELDLRTGELLRNERNARAWRHSSPGNSGVLRSC